MMVTVLVNDRQIDVAPSNLNLTELRDSNISNTPHGLGLLIQHRRVPERSYCSLSNTGSLAPFRAHTVLCPSGFQQWSQGLGAYVGPKACPRRTKLSRQPAVVDLGFGSFTRLAFLPQILEP